MMHSLEVRRLLSNRSHWPSRYQERRIKELALVRDICPGIPTTRGERFEAVTRLLEKITREQAEVLLVQLREASPAPGAWTERTPKFRREHARAVARLSGDWLIPAEWRGIARAESVTEASEDDKAWAAELIAPRRKNKINKEELETWAATRVVRRDELFGDVLVGEWD